LDFRWIGTKRVNLKIAKMPGMIEVLDATNSSVQPLTCHKPHHAKKLLGIFLAMDGNFKAQVWYLREKTVVFADFVRTGFLNQADAWYALTPSTIVKMLEYPLIAIMLTKRQWDYVLSSALIAALPPAGFLLRSSRALIFGPTGTLGMALKHPYSAPVYSSAGRHDASDATPDHYGRTTDSHS
jgi:hypothetical protein